MSVLAHLGSLVLVALTGYAIVCTATSDSKKEMGRWALRALGLFLVTLMYFLAFTPA